MHILLLGSSSISRKTLLQEAKIPFKEIGHTADEEAVKDKDASLQQQVMTIALHKMQHCVMPQGHESEVAYVLTADTMGCDSNGIIQGKPKNNADALEKLKACRQGKLTTATAFCLEKKLYHDGSWKTIDTDKQVVTAISQFYVPDAWIDRYFEHSLGLIASGAVAIELYGNQFLQSIQGSYSTIVGLPMYELREALEKMDFFV